MIEGSLEVKLPTIWKDEAADRRERISRQKIKVKVEKSRNAVFFQCFVVPEDRNVGSLKRQVRSHLAKWEMNNCTPLWRKADLEAKNLKTPNIQGNFGFGLSKKCTRLWCEAHFEVKMVKAHHVRSTCGRSNVILRGRPYRNKNNSNNSNSSSNNSNNNNHHHNNNHNHNYNCNYHCYNYYNYYKYYNYYNATTLPATLQCYNAAMPRATLLCYYATAVLRYYTTTLHCTALQLQLQVPVVPHKAVAEVSKIGNL